MNKKITNRVSQPVESLLKEAIICIHKEADAIL